MMCDGCDMNFPDAFPSWDGATGIPIDPQFNQSGHNASLGAPNVTGGACGLARILAMV